MKILLAFLVWPLMFMCGVMFCISAVVSSFIAPIFGMEFITDEENVAIELIFFPIVIINEDQQGE